MNAQQARERTQQAIARRDNETEAKLQAALSLVYGKVQEAADDEEFSVQIKYNGSKRSPHPALFIGEWPMLHWDGAETIRIASEAQTLVTRLRDEGYEAEAHYNHLEVKW